PDSGRLTGSDSGLGRLPEPERVVAQALAVLTQEEAAGAAQVLSGRHVVVSAGGTREPIDPVRYLGNRSSGRQGVAIAAEAARLGARVTLVAANIEAEVLRDLPAQAEVVQVSTALELREAVRQAGQDADVIVMAAAVADYRPAQVRSSKIKKHTLDGQPAGSLTGE
ncbi:MAG: Bifunctional phosphopantothenoylcysteine decarboxylase/phosphopantothenate synthase, partial [Actinomyces urogenitalis DORA_12]